MIKALLDKHLSKAFDNQLTDAVTPFTATRKGLQGEYDPITDSYESSDIEYSGRGVFESYKDFEVQATQIDITDVKLTCLQSEVTNTPQIDDVITADEQSRRIVNVSQDPTSSIWIIQLRGLNVGRKP